MSEQYFSDEKGGLTRLCITDLPQWQKEIIETRLVDIENNPSSVRDISELFEELAR